MLTHPVYKGCMRPALLLGIPLLPCMLVLGVLIIFSVAISLWFFVLMPVSIIVMRLMTAKDEAIFNIIFLNVITKSRILGNKLLKHRKSSLAIVDNS
jgi:type IV secretion system protein VirB3